MRGRIRSWKGRSGFDKIDLYTRGSLHFLVWMSLVCPVLLSVTRPVRHSGAPVWLIGGTVLAAVAQGLCSVPCWPGPCRATWDAGQSDRRCRRSVEP